MATASDDLTLTVRETQALAAATVKRIVTDLHELAVTAGKADIKFLLGALKDLKGMVPGLEPRGVEATATLVIDISRVPGVLAAINAEAADPLASRRGDELSITDVMAKGGTPLPDPDDDDPVALTLTSENWGAEESTLDFAPRLEDIVFLEEEMHDPAMVDELSFSGYLK